jgi:hypothetical protein
MSEKKELPPDRYYTPQVESSVSHKPPSSTPIKLEFSI